MIQARSSWAIVERVRRRYGCGCGTPDDARIVRAMIMRALAITVALLVFGTPSAHALVAMDASSSSSNEFGTTLTWTHTIGFESNRLLLVGVSTQYATAGSVTFNGVPLTLVGRRQGGSASNDGYAEIWSLVAPPTGTATIVVNVPLGDAMVAGAVSFYGVDQIAPLGAFTGANGQSTTPGVTVPSASGEIVFGTLMWNHDWMPVISGPSQTDRWNRTKVTPGFSDVTGVGSTSPGAPSVALSWTVEDDSWAVAAVSVRSAATIEYTLSEGATGAFFDLDILLANPNDVPVPITLTFLKGDGTTIVRMRTLPPLSRTTVLVDEIEGLESTEVSTTVTSMGGLPVVVERTMRWDETGYGSHTEKAAHGAERTWYFAEGSQGFFHTFLLLANPAATPNEATVDFLIENGATLTKTYPLAPTSRFTVDAATIPELRDRSFGIAVRFTTPGAAERAMYFGDTPLFSGGHESAGVSGASTDWFFAEGATGSFFTTFLLLANQNAGETAAVTVTYLPATGSPVTKEKSLAPGQRLTVNIATEDDSLASAAVATRVTSTLPIVAERSQYWPFTADRWLEAHNTFGATSAATRWGLAEGRVGGPGNYQTYILLANPGSTDATVGITFLRTNGLTVKKTFDVAAETRVTVPVGPTTLVPEIDNEEFGAIIDSTQPIVVERAMYLDANGVVWAAGSNATGTRLP
jgi:hypothetical protein